MGRKAQETELSSLNCRVRKVLGLSNAMTSRHLNFKHFKLSGEYCRQCVCEETAGGLKAVCALSTVLCLQGATG